MSVRLPAWTWVLVGCGCVVTLMPVVLALVLVPRIRRGVADTQAKDCVANVRQLVRALRQYAHDNDECLPRANEWTEATYRYVARSRTPLACPAVVASGGGIAPYAFGGMDVLGYAFNSQLGGARLSHGSAPASLRMLYDSTQSVPNANDPGTSLVSGGRHSGRNTIGYLDGHVQLVRAGGSGPGP